MDLYNKCNASFLLIPGLSRLAMDMDVYGYIHVWISDLGHAVVISMDM